MEERRDGSSVTRSCRWLQLFGSRSDRLPPLPTPSTANKPPALPPACACRHTLHHHAHALPISPPLGTQVTSYSLLPRPLSCTGATVRLARVSTTIGANGGRGAENQVRQGSGGGGWPSNGPERTAPRNCCAAHSTVRGAWLRMWYSLSRSFSLLCVREHAHEQ